jgi:hypothetical protein
MSFAAETILTQGPWPLIKSQHHNDTLPLYTTLSHAPCARSGQEVAVKQEDMQVNDHTIFKQSLETRES